jgi:hypothetical protein
MKLYLASAENMHGFNKVLEPIKAPNLLMSYFYLKGRKDAEIDILLTRARKFAEYIFLDS